MSMKVVYCKDAPSNQTIVDILKGDWYSAFPDDCHVVAGSVRHFDYNVEIRVKWANDVLPGGLSGRSVLELGPFEAYNTWMLENLGASPVTAVEANNLSYLKCLMVKEITGLKARFLYGDFIKYLEACKDPIDIVWASGVLYHQTEPLKLLGLIAEITDRIFVHTHYYDGAVIGANSGAAAFFDPELDEVIEYQGYKALHHYRSYSDQAAPQPASKAEQLKESAMKRLKMIKQRMVEKNNVFSGGMEDFSYWLEKKDILGFLSHLGFETVATLIDDPSNPNGPGMVFLTERKR